MGTETWLFLEWERGVAMLLAQYMACL